MIAQEEVGNVDHLTNALEAEGNVALHIVVLGKVLKVKVNAVLHMTA